jgi:hypothetical protein
VGQERRLSDTHNTVEGKEEARFDEVARPLQSYIARVKVPTGWMPAHEITENSGEQEIESMAQNLTR